MALVKPGNCIGCPLETLGQGFMQISGTGKNGVMLVGEALGEQEVIKGFPFVGPAGYTLDKILRRGDLDRDDFTIANTIWCRPPNNKLSGQWYAAPAISHCSPYLDTAIANRKPRCIVCLGDIAARRLLPDLPVNLLKARGYVFWSERYQVWVIPTVHPSFIMRGKTAWAQVLLYDIQHGIEIARDGYSHFDGDYLLDPTPAQAMGWAEEFERYFGDHPDLYLSTDIETPDKSSDEEDLELEEQLNYSIIRCGYSYKEHHALSIPWDGPYRAVHERLLGHPASKLFWNGSFDVPRIRAAKVYIGGVIHDAMDAWHVLNSDLKKSLGFVTPFFAKQQRLWKHLSSSSPAYYNAIDADMAGINMRGTVHLLKKNDLWKVYNEFICELDPVFSAMSMAGMPISQAERVSSSKQLLEMRRNIRARIQVVVPETLRPISPPKGYIRPPEDTRGLSQKVFEGVECVYCPGCGLQSPPKSHFKVYKRRANPCSGLQAEKRLEGVTRWCRVEDFVPSTKGVLAYQAYRKHPIIYTGFGADKKPTADEQAIAKLIGRYPKDEFYPLVLDEREVTKLGGTYIGWYNPDTGLVEGGIPIGRDGRVHGSFRHTPSTLRSSMVNPNLQNIPRADEADSLAAWVKRMFVAGAGSIFVARDYSGIEAKLVGYHAGSKSYTRLAAIDVHSYFTSHNLYRLGKITYADLPDLSWSDLDLAAYFKDIKKRFGPERFVAKVCVHAGNYRVGGKHLSDTFPKLFPRPRDAKMVLDHYYEVFPEIPKWHQRVCLQVDRSAIIKNSFGHLHRFYQVLHWEGGNWDYGDDAKRLIAFGPQSDAAFIGKKALKRCYYNYPDTMARWLRLFIHDEIFTETPLNRADEADSILQFEMEKPIAEMPLPASWEMGSHLMVGTEPKRGTCWADMH